VQRYLFMIDSLSMWSGKITAWLILIMTFLVTFDVSMRYLSKPLGAPIRAIWFTYDYSYDMSYYLYAIFFMLGGAYALSRGQHVRGDVFYRLWPVKVQASIDLSLYIVAFFPGILALVSVGLQWALASYAIGERSFTSAVAPVIWPLKMVIPIAGTLMAVQGVAETIRAFQALRTGVWPPRLSDVEELETVLAKQAEL